MSYDLEEESSVIRAPPMPIEGVRRVASVVLRSASTGLVPGLVNVESFLQRSGQSLYDGRTSYFDILMTVFPRGKPFSVSRAAIATPGQAKATAIMLSWAATCERWCAEYEELRKLHSSADRSTVYAKARSDGFRAAAVAALDDAKTTGTFGTGADWKAGTGMKAILKEVGPFALPGGDPLVDMTYQVLLMRPLVWHPELQAGASYIDPVVITTGAGAIIADWDQPWTLCARAVIGEFTTAFTNENWKEAALDGQVVYVDGAALTPYYVFNKAISQLLEESNLVYPGASKNPRPRRGVCPAGTEYVTTIHSERVTDKALDSAVRAALRKYGKIENVEVKCLPGNFTFDAIPLDESSLW